MTTADRSYEAITDARLERLADIAKADLDEYLERWFRRDASALTVFAGCSDWSATPTPVGAFGLGMLAGAGETDVDRLAETLTD